MLSQVTRSYTEETLSYTEIFSVFRLSGNRHPIFAEEKIPLCSWDFSRRFVYGLFREIPHWDTVLHLRGKYRERYRKPAVANPFALCVNQALIRI